MTLLKTITTVSLLALAVTHAHAVPALQKSSMTSAEAGAANVMSPADGDTLALPNGAQIIGKTHFTVLVEGQGPDVVLIPGLSTPRAVWDATAAQLKDRYRLHVVQLRGFGDAAAANADGPVLDPFTEELASYIENGIMAGNGGTPPAVIGHSAGGLSAMELALKHPGDVKRALVVDSLPFIGLLFGPSVTAQNIEPQAAAMRDAMANAPAQKPDERTLQTMSATQQGRAQVAAWSETADPRVTGQLFYDVMTTDIRPQIKGIAVPVTMLYPFDKEGPFPAAAVDALYTQAFAGADNVIVKRIEDSRHFIMLDQPEKFAEAVNAFLDAGK